MSVNSKNSTGKNDKPGKRAKRKKFEDSEEIESSEEELDLTKECHPIGYYINDRAEMINQMFSVIRGNKLKAMLPPILKDCDLDLLKLKCLDQLLGMSDKRITCILEGEVLETSSESDVDSVDYDSNEKPKSSSATASDRSDESMDIDMKSEAGKRTRVKGKKKPKEVNEGKSDKPPQNEQNPPGAEQGKTLLEILELEMRARAIRALLNQNEITNDKNAAENKMLDSKENGIKDNNDEVVDLTNCEDDYDYTLITKNDKMEEIAQGKESKFEEKIEKGYSERGSNEQAKDKNKRLQAELELRNKLFKKKIYRTRQQRMENEDDKISTKEEPIQKSGKPAEDPEEGEVSSSEDETSSSIKQNAACKSSKEEDNPDLHCKLTGVSDQTYEHMKTSTLIEDNKQTIKNDNEECQSRKSSATLELNEDKVSLNLEGEDDVLNIDSNDVAASLNEMQEESVNIGSTGETSWRERWLRKDGVQKLVKSSKIYAKVKKRIAEKSQRSKEETNPPCEAKSNVQSPEKMEVIEGSIKEYEKLIGKSVQSSNESNNVPVQGGFEESKSLLDGDNNVNGNRTTDNIAQNT